jgi:hypothetical protein
MAELNLLCQWARNVVQDVTTECKGGILNTGTGINGGFSDLYWSSSEFSAENAGFQYFNSGDQGQSGKMNRYMVRPVRAFVATCAKGGPCKVGDTGPGGGTVFYVHTSGTFACGATLSQACTYLEAAPTDYQVDNERKRVVWGCYGTATGALATEIGTGKANTDKILKNCITTSGFAADVADKYSTTNTVDAPGAAGQWFLPSKDELNLLCKIYSNGRTDTTDYRDYQNGCTGNEAPTGGFASFSYWSSSEEDDATIAWRQNFNYGFQYKSIKTSTHYVRPVRAF